MPSGSEPAWRVLVALLVYNGEDFAGLCLSSLTRLKPGNHSVDILVLDDASTAPGWSDRCRDMSTGLGFGYYRTPRNLGTPRNMNLAMQRAKDDRYDAVILLSADTIVPSNLIPALISPLIDDSSVSSTSAWSDDSGVFSIPTADPDHLTGHPDIVDWMKFSGMSWKKDGSGFYYSSFGVPKTDAEKAAALKAAAYFHKLYFHKHFTLA